MKRIIVGIIILILLVPGCFAEEEDEEIRQLYVISDGLNGRIRPGKKHQKVASFDMWTILTPTGRVSQDQMWIEIKTAEGDLVWCNVNYLSERREVIHVYTLWEDGIKIRQNRGSGRVTGKAMQNEILEITQVVMGYGKCSRGWVDLSYFIEDCD